MSFNEVLEIARAKDKDRLDQYIEVQMQLPEMQAIAEEYNVDHEGAPPNFVLDCVELIDGLTYTPVAYLIESGELDAAFFLLDQGASAAHACYFAAMQNNEELLERLAQYEGSSLDEALRGAGAGGHIDLIRNLREQFPEAAPNELAGAARFGHFGLIDQLTQTNQGSFNFQALICICTGIIQNRTYTAEDKKALIYHYLAKPATFPSNFSKAEIEKYKQQVIASLFFMAGIEGDAELTALLFASYRDTFILDALAGGAQGNQVAYLAYYLLQHPTLENFTHVLNYLDEESEYRQVFEMISKVMTDPQLKLPFLIAMMFLALSMLFAVIGLAMLFMSLPMTPIVISVVSAGASMVLGMAAASVGFYKKSQFQKAVTLLSTLTQVTDDDAKDVEVSIDAVSDHKTYLEQVPVSTMGFFSNKGQEEGLVYAQYPFTRQHQEVSALAI